jgi:hypothetical protein
MSAGHGSVDHGPAAGGRDSHTAAILIGSDRFSAIGSEPFVFGRADAPGIVGLDPEDMGISAKAGGVEFAWGVWWVVNHSLKRPLLIEETTARAPRRLECGDRYAVTSRQLVVLVPGAVYTHRIEVLLPEAAVARLHVGDALTSGTLTFDQVHLSDRDRLVLAAVFAGYLRSFPRHHAQPLSYQAAAEVLGPPWTRVTVRKQVERIKERFAREGVFFGGPRANDALAEHLLDNGLLVAPDPALVETERRTP